MKKSLASFARFCGRMLIALVVVIFMILVRLAYEPTPVNILGETIKEPFEAAFPDREFEFEGAFLEWNWDQTSFQFSLDDIRISNADKTTLAEFPKLAVSFNAFRLLLGTFTPERVDIYGAEINLDWDAQALGTQIENALLNPDEELPDPEDLEKPPVIRFMEMMLEGEGEDSALKNLDEVSVQDATITLNEKNTGLVWEMPGGDVLLTRGDYGLNLEADLTLVTRGEEVALNIRSEETGDGLTKTEVSMQGLNFTNLAEEVQLSDFFKMIDMPLYGTLTLWQNENGGVNLLGFDVGGGPGTIFYAPLISKPAKFEDVVFKGSLDPRDSLIAIESMRLELAGDVIEGDGFLEFTEEDKSPALRMVLTSERVKVDSFLQLWPTAKRSGGRDWIDENIENGVLENVRAELAFTPETWGMKPLPNEAMHITLDFVEGDIHFLRPMPPLLNGKGRVLIEGNELHGTLSGGVVSGTQVGDISFDISDMTRSKAQMGYAVFKVKDDLQKLMKFIDLDPLNIFIKQGLDPNDYFGEADLTARLTIPLYSGAPPEATDYTIEGTISKAAAPNLMAGGGMTEGEMQATVTPAGLVAQGHALLKGVPFDFYWTQGFISEGPDDFTTRVELSGNLTDEHLHVYGLPDDLLMDGTARVYMSLKGKDGDLTSGQGSGDFFNAKVNAARMDWHKEANRRAIVTFDLEWQPTELHLKNVKIESRELTFTGAFIFDRRTGIMKRADVPLYLTPINDLTATARQGDDMILNLTVQARSLNAEPFLATMFEEAEEESFAPNMHMILSAAQVYGMNEVVYRNVSIDANKWAEYWIEANVIGGLDEGGAFQVALTNDDKGRHLSIESDNAGRFALGTDIFRNATGGKLNLTADMNVYQEPLFAVGTLKATEFKMVKSSVLIQALSEEEKSGLDEMIREEGINFSSLEIPFRLQNKIFDISDASARGAAMGFTMEGQVDQDFYRMNLNGTIVPAYSLNTFISRIPIIGTIIAGGAGEGLFALNYRVTGTRDDPNVDFKEISAIAPGILRKILGHQQKGRIDQETSLQDETPPEGEGTALPEEAETSPEGDSVSGDEEAFSKGIRELQDVYLTIGLQGETVLVEFSNQSQNPVYYQNFLLDVGDRPETARIKIRSSTGEILSRREFSNSDWWNPIYLSSSFPHVLPVPLETLNPGEKIAWEFPLSRLFPYLEGKELEPLERAQFIEVKLNVYVPLDGNLETYLSAETDWIRLPSEWLARLGRGLVAGGQVEEVPAEEDGGGGLF